MRVLLDEQIPIDLAPLLTGHTCHTVIDQGWTGVKNGELLRRATDAFDVFVTMDRNLEFQQNIGSLALGILLIRAPSNRMVDLLPVIPDILRQLPLVQPGTLHRVGA